MQEGIQFDPLVWSSNFAQIVPTNQYNVIQDPSQLMADFVPSGESYVLSARLSGKASSAFDTAPEGSDYKKPHQAETQNFKCHLNCRYRSFN